MYAKKRHLKQLGYQEVNTRIFVNVFDAARKYHRILILATDTDVVDLEIFHKIYSFTKESSSILDFYLFVDDSNLFFSNKNLYKLY